MGRIRIFHPLEIKMPDMLANNYRYRRTFAKTLPAISVENLIQIQQEVTKSSCN